MASLDPAKADVGAVAKADQYKQTGTVEVSRFLLTLWHTDTKSPIEGWDPACTTSNNMP